MNTTADVYSLKRTACTVQILTGARLWNVIARSKSTEMCLAADNIIRQVGNVTRTHTNTVTGHTH